MGRVLVVTDIGMEHQDLEFFSTKPKDVSFYVLLKFVDMDSFLKDELEEITKIEGFFRIYLIEKNLARGDYYCEGVSVFPIKFENLFIDEGYPVKVHLSFRDGDRSSITLP